MTNTPQIVIAHPRKSSIDPLIAPLEAMNILRLRLTGGKTIRTDCSPLRQRRFPIYGAFDYLAGRFLGSRHQELVRFSLVPFFDRWASTKLIEGDTLLTGVGYMVGSLRINRSRGGLNILRAGNSHPSQFWSIVAEEHARWGIRQTPILPIHHMRQQLTVNLADWVISPSSYVTDSFVKHGHDPTRIITLPTVIDTSVFKHMPEKSPSRDELIICCSARLSLRKGAPYLFDAFGIVRKEVPHARLKLIRGVESQVAAKISKIAASHENIDWSDSMRHAALAVWLSSSDMFILPTLEEGMVRSAAEAMACGLPVITTANSGIDALEHHVNGSLVPMRDPEAMAREIIHWWNLKRSQGPICQNAQPVDFLYHRDSYVNHLHKGLKKIWPSINENTL